MSSTPVRWLFGDQLGPHFLDDHEGPVLMVESKAVFRRRRFHRAKAHLVLSAMRHRAAELGDRVTYVRSEGYAEAVREHVGDSPVEVIHPTSYAALGLVERLAAELNLTSCRRAASPPAARTYWWFLDRTARGCRTTRGCEGRCRDWTVWCTLLLLQRGARTRQPHRSRIALVAARDRWPRQSRSGLPSLQRRQAPLTARTIDHRPGPWERPRRSGRHRHNP